MKYNMYIITQQGNDGPEYLCERQDYELYWSTFSHSAFHFPHKDVAERICRREGGTVLTIECKVK